MKITTLAEARDFVKSVQLCTVFPSEKTALASLYEHVDLPEKQSGKSGSTGSADLREDPDRTLGHR